jgi:integrase
VGIYKRGRTWHFRKRVPRRFADVDGRTHVVVSLHTDSAEEARRRAADVERELGALWRARAAGLSGDAAARHAAAVKLAASRGVTWASAEALAAGSLEEIVGRFEALLAGGGLFRAEEADAMLGLAPAPALRLRAAFDVYVEETADRRVGLSPNQARKWITPKRRALGYLVDVVGDKRVDELRREDAVALRAMLRGRVEAGDMIATSANHILRAVSDLWRVLAEVGRVAGDNPFDGLRLRGALDRQRPSLTRAQVRAILAASALDGLNEEAADVVRIMATTGAGIAEVVGARLADLAVAAEVPHIVIAAHAGRRLKTPHRGRRIPLLGAGLEAARARAAAGGFPRYGDSPDGLSALVNKSLRARKLLAPGETIYSLRHAFQDRLIAAEVPERLQAELMGHRLSRPRYGAGPTLEHLAGWLSKAAP